VRAINAHDTHARFDQPSNQIWAIGCLARHRDHDAGLVPLRPRSQDGVRVFGEQRRTCVERNRRIFDDIDRNWFAQQPV
jgi:hypothetical protein